MPGQTVPYSSAVLGLETHRISETVFGYQEADLSFRATTTNFLDKILKALNAEAHPIIRWRVGLGAAANVQWLPWQMHYVLQYSAKFEGIGPAAGHYIKLFCRDMTEYYDGYSLTRAHRGTISTIVRKLATENGFSDTVIEDTQGEAVWIQSFEGDFEFIRSRLLPRARSTRGRGNYYMFVRDNVLHFHTVEYQTAIKEFNYYASPATRLEAYDIIQAKVGDGSAGTRIVYYDPYRGESKEVSSDPNKAIRLSNSMPRMDQWMELYRNICEHRISTRDEEAGCQALAQNAYEAARSESFQLKLQTSKTFFIRPGELMRLTIDPNAENSSTWSGLYLVAAAQHMVEKGELNSVYVLQRGEQRTARASANNMAAYGVDTLQAEQNAPGYDINVREAQSSTLAKGAGKAATGGAFLTVQDRSAALKPRQ